MKPPCNLDSSLRLFSAHVCWPVRLILSLSEFSNLTNSEFANLRNALMFEMHRIAVSRRHKVSREYNVT
jgi:hypothetical protein